MVLKSDKQKDIDLYNDVLSTLADYRNALLKHGHYWYYDQEYKDMCNEHEILLKRLAERLKVNIAENLVIKY